MEPMGKSHVAGSWNGWIAVFVALLGVLACSGERDKGLFPDVGSAAAQPVPPAADRIDHTPDTPAVAGGDWALPGRDYGQTRYSPLDQITTQNVGGLKVAWTFSTGIPRGHEGGPLVVNRTMYVVTPYPNNVFAIDLTNPHGPLKWAYHPLTDPASQGEACCDVVNRGASYGDGLVVFNRLDNHVVALDAEKGTVRWDTQLDSISRGSTMTMAPLIVKNKVIVGNSGGEMGVRGWTAALDLKSGRLVWRAYHTGPDRDVLIGPDFKPYYTQLQGHDLGVSTWPGDQWKLGGSTAWGWVTYDPSLNLIFYATSNPGVWNPDLRPGDNLWGATLFARDPDTGVARWAYQFTPHDAWDYDGVNESIVTDLPIGGTTRKVVVHFDRNGFAYTIDRATGEVLVAKPYQYVNWSSGVDLANGRPVRVPAKTTHQDVNTRNICPSSTGARDQQPAAFSPRTGLFYTPTTNLCMDYKGLDASYIAGTPYLGADVRMYAGPGGDRGEFIAWDAVQGRKIWGIKERFPVWSGALATAGDVVFYGSMDGWFNAVDAKNGKLLWKFKTGSGIIGNPMTYLGPDGKQYVAVYSGIGGWAGAVALAGMDNSDPTAALGAVGAMTDLPKYTAPGNTVYVFAL
jgi:alcohol dehydrogenase (cytochrome c)